MINKLDREKSLAQKAFVVWITGLSGSGKSTLACALEKHLFQSEYISYMLDGDCLRSGLNNDLGFSLGDRKENIRRVAEIAKLFIDAGLIIIASFISPCRLDREAARKVIGEDLFVEVYLDTPIATCEERDIKGLYRRARSGQIKNFTGIDSPYEEPKEPDIRLSTAELSVDICINRILDVLVKQGLIK